MKTKLALLTLVTSAVLALYAEKPSDLTRAVADSFKEHVGKVVTHRGRLEMGKQGPCLWGATPTNVPSLQQAHWDRKSSSPKAPRCQKSKSCQTSSGYFPL